MTSVEQPTTQQPSSQSPQSITSSSSSGNKLSMIQKNTKKQNMRAQNHHLAIKEELQIQKEKSFENQSKFKTKLCKHFSQKGHCPLKDFCQFAHGNTELRSAGDPLPENSGEALGAIHSNYKTMSCRNFFEKGECMFGDKCSFYHDVKDRRQLTDPLPNLPEGATLPPMPSKLKIYKENKENGYSYPQPQQIQNQPVPVFYPQTVAMHPSMAQFQLMIMNGFSPAQYGNQPTQQIFIDQFGNFVPPNQGVFMPYQQQAQQQYDQTPQYNNLNQNAAQAQDNLDFVQDDKV